MKISGTSFDKSICRLLAFFLFVFFCGAAGKSATIYVSAGGNDSNDGLSWGTAKLTVQAAVTAAKAGSHETILVNDGVFNNGSATIALDRTLSLQSVNGAGQTAIVKSAGGNVSIVTLSHAGAELKGFP